ncbi:MAG: hypothetical protein ACE5H5_06545 [Nitrospinota bacterium]
MTEEHKDEPTVYTCPTCGETFGLDLLVFLRHTDKHILEAIKESHPEWVEADGACPT